MGIKENITALIKEQVATSEEGEDGSVNLNVLNLIDKISQDNERLVEDNGLLKQHSVSLNGYVAELTKDLKTMRWARFWSAALLVCVVILTGIMFGYVILCPRGSEIFSRIQDEHVKLAFVVGCFATVFGLTALLVKGVFASSKQEDTATLIPEHFKLFLEAVRGGAGK